MPVHRNRVANSCQHCGNTFYAYASSKLRYCSHACSGLAHTRPVEERFWEKVTIGAPDECWPWTGSRSHKGYGRFYFNGRSVSAPRFAWEQINGPIPEGKVLRHVVCDNPPCVNEAHLTPGTPAENSADMMRKGRNQPYKNPARGERSGAYTHPEKVRRGEQHAMAKLTEADVLRIRERIAIGEPCPSIAADFLVTSALISMIGRRKIWRHI